MTIVVSGVKQNMPQNATFMSSSLLRKKCVPFISLTPCMNLSLAVIVKRERFARACGRLVGGSSTAAALSLLGTSYSCPGLETWGACHTYWGFSAYVFVVTPIVRPTILSAIK